MEDLMTIFKKYTTWNIKSVSYLITGIIVFITIYLMYPSLTNSAYNDIFKVISELGVPPFFKEIISIIIVIFVVDLTVIMLILTILIDSILNIINGEAKLTDALYDMINAVFMGIYILSVLYLSETFYSTYYPEYKNKLLGIEDEKEENSEIENIRDEIID